ncbi:PLDc N-terminal domain-containing protein [Paenibacillus cisolokensis]|uniref:PLDc N-terminal domain-containing protein n=1 Tax=Paenibacillus cisolokensis TaxID=1658519 RepID=UPI003D29F3FD
MNFEINWDIVWPILALQAVLAVTALISLARTATEAVRGPKWMWVLVIIAGNLAGSIAYFVGGRRDA